MGFFGDLFDDLLEVPAKVVEAPFKAVDRLLCLGDHRWSKWQHLGHGKYIRTCAECGAKETA